MSKKRKSDEFKSYQNEYIQESGKKLYLDASLSDVNFLFSSFDGRTTRVPTHRILLAAVSDEFKKIFYGKSKINGDVKVFDVSEAAFKEFLQYFYLNDVKLTVENINGVLHLGHKYNVKRCVENCIDFLSGKVGINNKNVCELLSSAILYDLQQLIKHCEMCIISNTLAVFQSAGFLKCEKFVLARILKLNVLSCSEVEVFHACMAWVKAKSGQNTLTKQLIHTHLNDLQYEIRFASMTTKEFCALEAKYSAVLRDDFHAIINSIASSSIQSGAFNKHPRQANWNENDIITCDRVLNDEDKRYGFILSAEYRATFSTNKLLLLGQFMCNKLFVSRTKPSRDLRSDLSVEVSIEEKLQ